MVNDILVQLNFLPLLSSISVKALSFFAVGIIDTENAVFPSGFHESFPLGEEHVLLLEGLVGFQCVAHFCNLLTGLGRVP
jgi:hypothetical protein